MHCRVVGDPLSVQHLPVTLYLPIATLQHRRQQFKCSAQCTIYTSDKNGGPGRLNGLYGWLDMMSCLRLGRVLGS